MTVFVTGINGLLGTNLALLLLQKGYQVRGLVRSRSSYKPVVQQGLQLIEGSLQEDLSPYLQGVDTVIHAAATTRQDLIRYRDYYQLNCIATRNLLSAAIQAGVKQFIYVSSANTIGYGPAPGSCLPEDRPIAPPFTRSFYARSKAAAEAHLLGKQHEIEVQVVHPSFMIGPNDSKPSSGRIIVMALKKRILFYPPGGKNFVAVHDVALGIEKCIRSGQNGQRYLLVGDNMSYKTFFRLVRQVSGRKQLLLPLPVFLLRVAGCVGDWLRLMKIETELCTNNMQILCIRNYYDNQTSVSALGLQYQPIEKAVVKSVAYFRS